MRKRSAAYLLSERKHLINLSASFKQIDHSIVVARSIVRMIETIPAFVHSRFFGPPQAKSGRIVLNKVFKEVLTHHHLQLRRLRLSWRPVQPLPHCLE